MKIEKDGTDWPEAYGRIILPEVSSTLDEARDRAGATSLPFWLLAHRQTAARGRRGRAWSMPDGNFGATLVLPPDEYPADAALRSFVLSLALIETFDVMTGRPEAFSLKWPNDVLLNNGKVAGILLERSSDGPLFLGVGVNLVAGPDPAVLEQTAVPPVSLLAETGIAVTPEAFLSMLAARYAVLEHQFKAQGFSPLRTAWLARAARLGEEIRARTMREDVVGIFEDVDAGGHLVIRGPRGLRRLAAADVYF